MVSSCQCGRLKEQLSQGLSEIIKQQPEELSEENVPKQSSGTFQFSRADGSAHPALSTTVTRCPGRCLYCRMWLGTG